MRIQRVHIIELAVPPAAEGGCAVRERMHDHEASNGTNTGPVWV